MPLQNLSTQRSRAFRVTSRGVRDIKFFLFRYYENICLKDIPPTFPLDQKKINLKEK
jgi:hypothetical protein